MGGISSKTTRITLRLPNEVYFALSKRAKQNGVSAYEYLTKRVIYDTLRKHVKGKELPIGD